MKLHFKIICIALFAISIASCKKDSSTSAPVQMSAVIDGKTWTPGTSFAILATSNNESYFTITGTSLSASLVIVVQGATTGTYSLSLGSVKCGATYIPSLLSPSDFYLGISGTVKLTKVDVSNKLISGTYNFTLSNSTTITNGQFNDLSYQ